MSDELGEIEKVLDSMRGQVLPVGHTVRSSITLGVAPADLSSIHRCAKSLDDENDRLRAQVDRFRAAVNELQGQPMSSDLFSRVFSRLEPGDLDLLEDDDA